MKYERMRTAIELMAKDELFNDKNLYDEMVRLEKHYRKLNVEYPTIDIPCDIIGEYHDDISILSHNAIEKVLNRFNIEFMFTNSEIREMATGFLFDHLMDISRDLEV